MKYLILFIITSLSIISCGDIEQNIVIEANGKSTLTLGMDVYSLMQIGEKMLEDSLSENQPSEFDFQESIKNPDALPEKLDTMITLDQDESIGEVTNREKELLKKIGVRFDVDKSKAKAVMQLFLNYDNLEERDEVLALTNKIMSERKEGDEDDSGFDTFKDMLPDYELDLRRGKMVIKEQNNPDELNKMAGGEDDDAMTDEDLAMMAKFLPGGINRKITTPGKIYKVHADEYKMINDYTVLVKTSYVDMIKSQLVPGFSIDFEPTEPITDPKLTEVWDPEPVVVTPAKKACKAPSDAIVLFAGKSGDEWVHYDGRPMEWDVKKNHMTIKPGTGTIKTKRDFGDIQLHMEWRSPKEPELTGQEKGNSGIFFQNKYEVQILNSYQNRTYSNGQAGAVYKQYAPLVNAMKPPGEWNIYDIIFHAPRFDEDGALVKKGTLTVMHNGILIQDHVEIQGTTEYIGRPKIIPHGPGPLVIQDHSNKISFRNIWVREL